MKLTRFIIFLIVVGISFAAAPVGYYDSATGLTGNDLRLALHNIIDDHIVQTYEEVWAAFETTDEKANGKIWDMYTGIEFTFSDDQQSNDGEVYTKYNREHSWPKSWANESYPHYTDLFHLYPTQAYANSIRNNLPYGEVGSSVDYTSLNGTKKGDARSGLGYVGSVFEPIDEYKGDFARTYFYMSTRYYTDDVEWDVSGMTDKCELKDWAVSMLLNWHNEDPVSQKELDRIEAVYAIQGNRNPFIDHPEYVADIWDLPATSFGAPTAQSASSIEFDSFTANWSSVADAIGYKLYVSLSSDFSSYISGYGPYDAGNVQNTIVSGLASSVIYYYRVVAYKDGEESGNSNVITVETTPPTGIVDGTKIFFSEYIEGSSYNKALEIYNGAGADIDLSKIVVELYSNGSSTVSNSLVLSGTLISGDVYVIAYESGSNTANATILAEADLTIAGVVNFNGDDALEMYYNGVLVDVFGIVGTDPGTSWTVAGNSSATVEHTLVRKASVTNGNTDWVSSAGTTTENSEWIVYPQNETSYLGSHTVHDTPLPITLISFDAQYFNGSVKVSWSTASEFENASFNLYRNGEVIARLEGAGTTNKTQNYNYIDKTVVPGVQYTYMLADIDYANHETRYEQESQTINISNDIVDMNYKMGRVYPNPFNPSTILPLTIYSAQNVKITLHDLQGKKLMSILNEEMNPGSYNIRVDMNEFSSAVYLLRVQIGENLQVQKLALSK